MTTSKFNFKIALLATSIVFAAGFARAQAIYDPQQEMTTEMGVIVNKLALSKPQAFEVANILNDRMMMKQAIFDQMAELYKQLERFDHSADRQIKAALNGDQREIWDKELAIKLWEERAKRQKGENTPKVESTEDKVVGE